jgi:hypothetical protein
VIGEDAATRFGYPRREGAHDSRRRKGAVAEALKEALIGCGWMTPQ